MTVQFVGLDDNEGVIASDTRVVYPDGSYYDDFINPKVYRFGPRLLAVFSGMTGAINRLVSDLAWVENLTPQKIVGRVMAHCSHATGQERLDVSILGDENGEMVIYRVSGHLDEKTEIPYEVIRRTKEDRPILLRADREAMERVYKEYLTGMPIRDVAIRAVQILGELHPHAFSRFPEVWVLPKEGPAFCYKSTHVKTMPIINGLNQVRATSGEGVNSIYGNGFQIDKTGLYGYSGGVKRVEIKPDGRLSVGTGRVVGDELGLKLFNKAYTDPTAVMTYHQKIDGSQEFYNEDTGAKSFTITAKGELKDSEGYTVLDVNGFNGKLIMQILFLPSEDGFHFGGLWTPVDLGSVTVPPGKMWYATITPVGQIPILYATEKAIKTLRSDVQYQVAWSGEDLDRYRYILYEGEYNNVTLLVVHWSHADYTFTDDTTGFHHEFYDCLIQIWETNAVRL